MNKQPFENTRCNLILRRKQRKQQQNNNNTGLPCSECFNQTSSLRATLCFIHGEDTTPLTEQTRVSMVTGLQGISHTVITKVALRYIYVCVCHFVRAHVWVCVWVCVCVRACVCVYEFFFVKERAWTIHAPINNGPRYPSLTANHSGIVHRPRTEQYSIVKHSSPTISHTIPPHSPRLRY